MMINFEIKSNATLSDIKAMAAIESQLFNDAWNVGSIQELLKQPINQVLILKAGETLAGYCLYQRLFETAEILRIATHPSFQRQGYANQLMTAWIAKMTEQDVSNLLLEVRADNLAAIALYQQFDFKRIDIRKGYYQNKNSSEPAIDAWIMQRQVSMGVVRNG